MRIMHPALLDWPHHSYSGKEEAVDEERPVTLSLCLTPYGRLLPALGGQADGLAAQALGG